MAYYAFVFLTYLQKFINKKKKKETKCVLAEKIEEFSKWIMITLFLPQSIPSKDELYKKNEFKKLLQY